MPNVALAICYQMRNYGSVLQAYATQKYIEELGLEIQCVNYRKKKTVGQIVSYLPQIFIPGVVKMKLDSLKKAKYLKLNTELSANIKKRHSMFNVFVEQHFKVSKQIIGFEALKEYGKQCNAVVLGSDQVWHPINMGSDFYTLQWVSESVPKIAYASSFGVSQIPAIQKRRTCRYLERINYLSTREKSGQQLIKELTGRDVTVVLDPTMLFKAEAWDTIQTQERVVDDKYILCYFLGTNEKHRLFAKELQKETEYKIVTLPHLDEIVEADFNFGEKTPYNVGPSEFLNLVKHAEMVCTDSFHGTVFSILYQKPFLTFPRYKAGSTSTNSRLESLLYLLGLSGRMINENQNLVNQMQETIDYEQVHSKIAKLREQSENYLKNALKEVGILK